MKSRHSLEEIINNCNEIYKIPTLTEAYSEVDENKLIVETYWSQLDVERNQKTKYCKRFVYLIGDNETVNLADVSKPVPVRADTWQVKNQNNSNTAVVSEFKDKNGDSKQYLEIWNDDVKIKNKNLSKEDKHGKLYEMSLGWSSDSTKIAYLAEMKRTNTETCFLMANKNKDNKMDVDNYQEKYANFYVDTWGEQMGGKSQSSIILYNLQTDEIKILSNVPKNVCPLNITWYKNEGIVFTGYNTEPYRLGIVYCPIRQSDFFYYDIENDTCTQLTNGNHNVRSASFSNDFTKLCWFENSTMGPHLKCSKLMIMDWNTKTINTLVDIVNEQNDNKFPGLFEPSGLKNCWSSDDKRIVFNTHWNHKSRIVCCNVETKELTVLDNLVNDLNYLNCIRFSNDWLCGLVQGYNKKPTLVVGKLPEAGNEKNIKWIFTSKSSNKNDLDADVSLLKFQPNLVNQKYPNLTFESILVQPKQNRNDVLVVFPHGGPHSAFLCEYNPHVAILYSLGYSTVLVNFRGSTGYGEDSINSLPGNVGVQDVADVQQAAEYCMKTYNFKNAVLYGGSHGGFLSTHLVGQYPDFYSSAVVRNPVTSLETNRANSDIPDWAFTETFSNYDFDYNLVINDMKKLELIKQRSPINYIDSVKTPILFMIGECDLRVPPAQSIEYYRGLLQRKKETKLLWYKEDNHSLDKPQTTYDCIVNAILWFEKYL